MLSDEHRELLLHLNLILAYILGGSMFITGLMKQNANKAYVGLIIMGGSLFGIVLYVNHLYRKVRRDRND